MSVAFDSRPLVEPVDRRAAAEHTRRLKAEGRIGSTNPAIVSVIVMSVLAVIFLPIIIIPAVGLIVGLVAGGDGGFAVIFLLPFVAIVTVLVFTVVKLAKGGFGASTRRYRLDRFAQANAMTYVPALANPALPGMIFGRGSSRRANDLVRGQHPRFVEFANYMFVTGSGKNRTTHRWGYVAVKLDVPLPHIVLDATGNNGLFGSNLPASFRTDQRLSLEGDFDRYFSLYCPREYERDALYLFTPDIMARFIDHAAELDVEIVDDWMFLYAKRDLSTLDPATWGWLFSVVGALLDKLHQWGRWRDDRLEAAARAVPATTPASATSLESGIPGATAAPPPLLRPPAGVAPAGRRLSRRVSTVTIIVIVGVAGFWIVTQLGGFLAVFSGVISP